MNSLGFSKQSCRWEGNSLFLPSLYLFLQYFFHTCTDRFFPPAPPPNSTSPPLPPSPPDQIITGYSITQINAYLFLSYQWMWQQQRRRRQWRREQWWKRCACSSMQQRRHGCGSEQRACVRQQAAAAGGMIAMDCMQPACMWQWAADGACMQQHAAVAAYVRQRAGVAGSTIAIGYSDGSGQPVAQ